MEIATAPPDPEVVQPEPVSDWPCGIPASPPWGIGSQMGDIDIAWDDENDWLVFSAEYLTEMSQFTYGVLDTDPFPTESGTLAVRAEGAGDWGIYIHSSEGQLYAFESGESPETEWVTVPYTDATVVYWDVGAYTEGSSARLYVRAGSGPIPWFGCE